MQQRTELSDTPAEPAARAGAIRSGSLSLTAVARQVLAVLVRWQARASERRHLADLDRRMRRDIGLPEAEIRREASKPFWLP
jgi:uncharacterized protein YjiS (DUF1127 family)